jgi:ribonuclease P protein component
MGDGVFSMTVRPNDQATARLGLAIAARVVGNAVARNRVRRLIRESFRHAQHRLPAADIIVGARSGARDAPADRLRDSLDALWTKVATRCASSSAS